MEAEQKLPSFIRNSPLGQDLFEGKAQEKIANSITHLILDANNTQKLIGIEGQWGAGKSNLIKIVEGKLKETHLFFIHDAWGHQEDLQRRTFLEELTACLYTEQLLEKSKWGRKLSDLLSKKQVTKTKSTPQLSTAIVLTLAIAILTPLIKVVTDIWTNTYIKLAIAILPFFVLTIYWLIQSYRKRKVLLPNELFYLYKEKELENYTETTTSEKEPSVTQFRNWMQELSTDLSKKLVVVFDNMDRLPPDKVKILWSSINTFFSDNSFENIWVIVPFDKTHIATAFSNEAISEQFIMKSFPVIFKVSEPVLSDWHKFFRDKFTIAFQDFEEEEYIKARTIFDLHYQQITPRLIISFINELVATKRVFGEEISLRYIALYNLCRKKIEESPVDRILDLEFVKPYERAFIEDKKIQDNIAALFYNVPVDSASQVVLQREIQLAIRNNDTDRLIELANHQHFLVFLEKMIIEASVDIPELIVSLNSIEEKILNDGNKLLIANIWSRVGKDAIATLTVNQEYSDFHGIIVLKISHPERINYIKYFVKGLRSHEKIDGTLYHNSLKSMKEVLKTTNIVLSDFITELELEPEEFLNYVNEAKDQFEVYKVVCQTAKINIFLIKEIDANRSIKETIKYIEKTHNLKPTIDHLRNLIIGDKITEVNAINVYTLLKAIADDKPLPPLKDSKISSLLDTFKEDSDFFYDLFAMRVGRGTSYTHYNMTLDSNLTSPSDKLIKKVSENIEFYTAYGTLLEMASRETNNLLNAVLMNLTMRSYGISRMDIVEVLKVFPAIVDQTGIPAPTLINRLNDWVRYAKERINPQNVNDNVNSITFYECAVKIKNILSNYIIKLFKEFLKSLSRDDWEEAILQRTFYYEVFILLLFNKKIITLPSKATEAIKVLLKQYALGIIDLSTVTEWELIKDNIVWGRLHSTIKDIRDEFILNTGITPSRFLFLFELLIKYGSLEDRSGDVVRRILVPVIDDQDCLDVMIKSKDIIAPIIKKARGDNEEFINRLLERNKSDQSNELTELINMINPKRKNIKLKKNN